MRDAWAKMLDAAERALEQFVLKLPADYRSRHLSLQPDIVWGQRVLPNFRRTMSVTDECLMELKQGDLNALGVASGINSDVRAQGFDYPADWMPKDLEEQFWTSQHEASLRASNISHTKQANWTINDLTSNYNEPSRGPLDPPSSWPLYRLNAKVTVKTGDPVAVTGIYLPACDDSCAALLIKRDKFPEASEANIGYDPKTMQRVGVASTLWTLVERVADSGGGTPSASDDIAAGIRIRVQSGQICPRAGYYFTPAQTNSRRNFKQGEVMPSVGGDYGVTIWQWDDQQS
jgi:hypothetical protein